MDFAGIGTANVIIILPLAGIYSLSYTGLSSIYRGVDNNYLVQVLIYVLLVLRLCFGFASHYGYGRQ